MITNIINKGVFSNHSLHVLSNISIITRHKTSETVIHNALLYKGALLLDFQTVVFGFW